MLKYLYFFAAFACSGSAALGQDAPAGGDTDPGLVDPVATVPDKAIVVVATGLPSDRSAKALPVSVMTDADLRAVQGPDLSRALRRLPGVTLTRNSGLGAFTGVRVRGAGAEQLLVLIDGVKVNDPSSPGGGFDFGNLMADEVGKVELLRGSHSVIWGSDAIAGVMNLSTRMVDGLGGSIEYGGARQFSGQALAGLKGRFGEASLSGGYVHSRGISAAAIGAERDGFEQWRLSGRGKVHLADGLSAVFAGRVADGELEIDGFPPPTFFIFDDTHERQDTHERSGRAGLEYTAQDLTLNAGVSHSRNARDLFDEDAGADPYYESDGRLTRAELFGRLDLGGQFDNVRLDFGADHEWSRFAANSAFSSDRGSAWIASGHAMITYDRGDLSLGAGMRYDHHDRFGGAWTFGTNGSAEIARDVRLRASYGEGFKAPTLFQLLSDFGNAGLRPERSRSYDVGVLLDHGGFAAELSLFRRATRDLIDFVSCAGVAGGICTGRPFGTYDNVGRARAEGFELAADWRVEGRQQGHWPLRFHAAYSYVKATDRLAGTDLARRPRHALSVSGDWTIDAVHVFSTTLGADLRLVGDSFDDAANRTRIDGHAVVDLRATRPLFALNGRGQRTVDLFGRIENLFEANYTEVAGYATQGRAAYLGIRVGL